jgi:hypothetical protein
MQIEYLVEQFIDEYEKEHAFQHYKNWHTTIYLTLIISIFEPLARRMRAYICFSRMADNGAPGLRSL